MPPLPKPTEGGNFAPTPSGTHLAMCYRIIDLGTQPIEYKGEKKMQHKILISWELPDELMPDGEKEGEPFTVHHRYTWSMHEKASLRRDLESWRGLAFQDGDFGPGGFEIQNILGKPCLITIVHETKGDKTYANIASISKLPKGMQAPKFPKNDPKFCWLNGEEFDRDVFDSLSDKLKQAIMDSPEYKAFTTGGGEHITDAPTKRLGAGDLDDEIPFGPETR